MNQAENYCRVIKRMSNRNVLPPEYQQVEYLWSYANSGAYIKTGFIPTQRFVTRVRVQYRESTGLIALGCFSQVGNNMVTFGIAGGDGPSNYYRYANPNSSLTNYTWTNIRSFVEGEDVTLIEDWVTPLYSVEDSTSTPNNYFPTFVNAEFYLFGRRVSDNGLMNQGSMRIYRAEIFDSQLQPVRNYIPCYRRSDNKPGMYDTVNHTFNTNAGHGANFTLGADV